MITNIQSISYVLGTVLIILCTLSHLIPTKALQESTVSTCILEARELKVGEVKWLTHGDTGRKGEPGFESNHPTQYALNHPVTAPLHGSLHTWHLIYI